MYVYIYICSELSELSLISSFGTSTLCNIACLALKLEMYVHVVSGWALMSLPIQAVLGFYESMILDNLLTVKICQALRCTHH